MSTHLGYLQRLVVPVATGALILGTAATAAAATATAAPPPSRSAPTTSVTVDDARTGGTNHFSYSSGWKVCQRCDQEALGGSYHYTTKTNASVTLSFTGRRATIYGIRQTSGGRVLVTVDGRATGIFDLYTKGQHRHVGIYTTPVLRDGPHTVTFTTKSRTRGGGHTVSIDRAVVERAGDTPTTR